jgi:hypothetical protein
LESTILRDRLYRSKASPNCLAAMGGTPPEFPFTVTDVKKGRVQKTAQQNTQQNYGKQESYESSNSQQQGYTQGSQQTTNSTGQAVQQVSAWTIIQQHKIAFAGI